MDLRTKLVFAFVSVSLVSMFALTLLIYGPSRDAWRDSALNGLEALAESKKSDLDRVVEGWADRVRLISSRTQLRRITAAYDRSHTPGDAADLVRILTDAQAAIRGSELQEITVYDTHQHVIASSLWPQEPARDPIPDEWLPGQQGTRMVSFTATPGAEPEVEFTSPVQLDGVVVGTVLVKMSAVQLTAVTENYQELGRTGETLLATRDETGAVLFIGSPRHEMPNTPPAAEGTVRPLLRALEQVDSTFFRGAVDYRGEEVWAVTRHLESLEVGLVVKVDRVEQEAPLTSLRRTTIRLALALSAFAILVAVLMGLSFAAPIHQLAEVAEEIYAGNYRVRAPVRREDEIGRLAFVFNRMTDGLLDSNRKLRQRIAEQDRIPGAEEHEGALTERATEAHEGAMEEGALTERATEAEGHEGAVGSEG